jgi:hypothetical protein
VREFLRGWRLQVNGPDLKVFESLRVKADSGRTTSIRAGKKHKGHPARRRMPFGFDLLNNLEESYGPVTGLGPGPHWSNRLCLFRRPDR